MTSRLELPRCLLCEQALESDPTEWPPTGGMHPWCLALKAVGHSHGYCACTDYGGLSRRDAARVVVGLLRRDAALSPDVTDDRGPDRMHIDWEAFRE